MEPTHRVIYGSYYALVPIGFIIAYSIIIGLRPDDRCDNHTWIMGCVILATHCVELFIGIILAVLLTLFRQSAKSIVRGLQWFLILWTT